MDLLSEVTRIRLQSVDSTSSEARRLLQSGGLAVPAAITAEVQTNGRGRFGRSFYSPKDGGIYLSIVDTYPETAEEAALITVRTSIAVADAIQEVTGIEADIKWVNDLYRNGRKICGILTEAVFYESRRFLIIGIGINVSTEPFPEELRKIAASLEIADSGIREQLTDTVILQVLQTLRKRESCMAEYKRRSMILGRTVSYLTDGIRKTGIAADIDESGALLVDLPDGTRDTLRSGDVSLETWR